MTLLTAALAAACGDGATGPAPPIDELPRALTVAERAVIAGSNRFAWELLREVAAEEPGASVFLSPLSASMALGMTLNGAAGGTFDEMREVLGFGGLGTDEINASYRELVRLLTNLDPDVRVRLANAIWHRRGLTLEAPFLEAVRTTFGATVEGLDFTSAGAPETINRWVRESTEGKIAEMVKPPIPGNTVALLMNAVYFKGAWRIPFDPRQTRDASFHVPGGAPVTVKMMQLDDTLAYHETGAYQAADLAYGGGAFSMTLVLPREGTELAAFLTGFDEATWSALLDGLRTERVLVMLPRFRLEFEKRLNDPLIRMGMPSAFDARADFSRMIPGGGGEISEVKQKTFVEVNEEGTEAAAATSVSVVDSAPPTLRLDRPFVFLIRERLTGTILFVGTVVEAPVA